MSTYIATFEFTGTANNAFGLTANTYQVRITKIDFYAWSYVQFGGFNSVGGLSGGSVVTPIPLFGGAPPSTAIAKNGVTGVGTQTTLFATICGSTGEATSGTTTEDFPVGGNTSYSFGLDYILPTGSAFIMTSSINPGGFAGNTYFAAVAIYYEELRLSWHQ